MVIYYTIQNLESVRNPELFTKNDTLKRLQLFEVIQKTLISEVKLALFSLQDQWLF